MSSAAVNRVVVVLAVLIACLSVFLATNPEEAKAVALLPETSGGTTQGPARSRALIWTAHPDDESMFFAPVVLGLARQDWDVDALCMSLGDADGKGAVRRQELFEAYELLGVPRDRVTAMNLTDLPDGMKTEWGIDVLVRELESYLGEHPVDVIITFDGDGVSHHPNHRALHAALSTFFASPSSQTQALRGWGLVSLSLPRKYSGAIGLALRHVGGILGDAIWRYVLAPPAKNATLIEPGTGEDTSGPPTSSGRTVEVAPAWIGESLQDFIAESRALLGPRVRFSHGLEGYRAALRAMRRHRSQMVWFRWGYVASSRYMWEAELGEIRPQTEGADV